MQKKNQNKQARVYRFWGYCLALVSVIENTLLDLKNTGCVAAGNVILLKSKSLVS